MKAKIKPIRDLYFRFIRGTRYEGCIDAQTMALELSRLGYIELIAHHSSPLISHYRDIIHGIVIEDLDLVLEKYTSRYGKP